ncbi:L-rhamnose mutarotase [Aestuariibaculum lutulentum]|uniref:L-rhamnose mutarotase n=1 Tax=Aestuariibaculum lutulentum TaxID=2920935 RepID=A0ABS9RFC2_9FLAO|nr:L-rhamnose mutarotase [Aestuariibaculum lutulentum]MCH4551639.1 L-rhamnose mutarotase [Aestuariibaculum lutulentum]
MKTKRYALACDLKDNPELIAEYIKLHKNVWPEILESIKAAGIEDMEIFNIENRLFMIMEVNDDFSFDKKAEMDINNPKVQEWENFMWKFQQELPMAKPGEKWMLLDSIFKL